MFEVNCDIGFNENKVEITKPSVESILKYFKSGIALDISKCSTGVCIWYNNKVENYVIHMDGEVDLSKDTFAEENMRREFRSRLIEIINGRNFEYGVVEDVFGGKNFDTVRKLLTLNTVFDGMILDGIVKVDHYYKRVNKTWKKYFRKIVKIEGTPTDKYEIQEIMRFLEFDYFLKNEHLSNSEKDNIGFQDVLDATGILCALSIELNSDVEKVKPIKVSMSKIQMFCYDNKDDFPNKCRSKKIKQLELVELQGGKVKNIEKTMIDALTNDISKAYMLCVDNDYLGYFGMRYDVKPSSTGKVYIVFCIKGKKV